uniref:Uncharacterized protein n=1 Tax=Tetranychus urticae TaxID=32264 RepID=T1JR34_TETUR
MEELRKKHQLEKDKDKDKDEQAQFTAIENKRELTASEKSFAQQILDDISLKNFGKSSTEKEKTSEGESVEQRIPLTTTEPTQPRVIEPVNIPKPHG